MGLGVASALALTPRSERPAANVERPDCEQNRGEAQTGRALPRHQAAFLSYKAGLLDRGGVRVIRRGGARRRVLRV
jgi:hypothetical protein